MASEHVSAASEPACHACGAAELSAFSECAALPAVASDCRPWPGSYRLGRCQRCGLVQKCLDAAWRADAERIYASYALYHQTSDGSEQLIFDQTSGRGRPRSELMFEALQSRFSLPQRGRSLDLGCGTGPTLRAFAKLLPGWRLFGYDPHLPERDAVLEIPGVEAVYEGALADVADTFDLVTAVHVLEHVPAPLEFLSNARRLLGARGLFFVQVPYFPETPFDLTVFDHCSHFSEHSLRALFRAAGLHVELFSTQLLPKEISVVARAADATRVSPAGAAVTVAGAGLQHRIEATAASLLSAASDSAEALTAATDAAAVTAALDWLDALRAQALGAGDVGVFGTSIGGNWLLSLLGAKLRFFVDEDPKRAGAEYRGRPVYTPANVPRGSRVLMPLPFGIASAIRERLRPGHFELVVPPAPRGES